MERKISSSWTERFSGNNHRHERDIYRFKAIGRFLIIAITARAILIDPGTRIVHACEQNDLSRSIFNYSLVIISGDRGRERFFNEGEKVKCWTRKLKIQLHCNCYERINRITRYLLGY